MDALLTAASSCPAWILSPTYVSTCRLTICAFDFNALPIAAWTFLRNTLPPIQVAACLCLFATVVQALCSFLVNYRQPPSCQDFYFIMLRKRSRVLPNHSINIGKNQQNSMHRCWSKAVWLAGTSASLITYLAAVSLIANVTRVRTLTTTNLQKSKNTIRWCCSQFLEHIAWVLLQTGIPITNVPLVCNSLSFLTQFLHFKGGQQWSSFMHEDLFLRQHLPLLHSCGLL